MSRSTRFLPLDTPRADLIQTFSSCGCRLDPGSFCAGSWIGVEYLPKAVEGFGPATVDSHQAVASSRLGRELLPSESSARSKLMPRSLTNHVGGLSRSGERQEQPQREWAGAQRQAGCRRPGRPATAAE